MKTILIATAALLALTGCESVQDTLMSMSDDPCRGLTGCTASFPKGNDGPATFTHDGKVIATWRAVAPEPK